MRRLAIALFVFACAVSSSAERIVIASRDIDVQLPQPYRTGAKYPVLYVLDGETLFAPASSMTAWLQYVTRVPGMIVVAIRNKQRTADMTTGAAAFRAFLKNEVEPEIEKRYATATYRILFGHSLAAMFALDTVTKDPAQFQIVIAISSPNSDDVVKALRSPAFVNSTVRVFAGAAGNDPSDTLPMFHRVVEALTNTIPATRWRSQMFPDEDHGTVAIPAMYAGLQFAFPQWHVPGYASDAGVAGIKEFYRSLSKLYGYDVPLQERELARLAYQWLRANRNDDAIELFAAIAHDHPSSANAHDDLGNGLSQGGRRDEARAEYAKAVELAQQSNDPMLETYRAHLASVAK